MVSYLGSSVIIGGMGARLLGLKDDLRVSQSEALTPNIPTSIPVEAMGHWLT